MIPTRAAWHSFSPHLALVIAAAAPLYAVPDEQKSMRAVASLARWAIGAHCVDPEGEWTLAPPPPEYLTAAPRIRRVGVEAEHPPLPTWAPSAMTCST
jgi:hypothetical protein